MEQPFNWSFPQRSQTMYMSTIDNSIHSQPKPQRQSSFLKHDIQGASSRNLIPSKVHRENYNYSTHIQPRPQQAKSIKKVSDPLKHRDIEGSYPRAVEFKTNRSVNPLLPCYNLPTSNPIISPSPNKFIRDAFDVRDIVEKKKQKAAIESPKNQIVEGSGPKKLFKVVDAVARLDVKDINNDGIFVSKRISDNFNPLFPHYQWKDKVKDKQGFSFTKSTLKQEDKALNQLYGKIDGTESKSNIRHHPVNRTIDLCLKIKDIQGTNSNSMNQSRYFFSKRKDYRQNLKVSDIEKTAASSLKKGIETKRSVNPLMPKYHYPS